MDDVQYMLHQSSQETFLFIIDSGMRDTTNYPTPSEYYVPFPIPFRNVCAVDLVDAQIPRTEYSIEQHTNDVAYAPGTYATYDAARAAGQLVTARISPGDYNVPQLVETLNEALATTALALGHQPVVVVPLSDPIDLTNKLTFTRAEPFTLFIGNSSMRAALGFGNPSHAPGGLTAWDGSARYVTDALVANDVFASVPAALSSDLAFAGPVPIDTPGYSLALTQRTRQRFTAATSGLLSSIVVRKSSGTASMQVSVYDVDLNALVHTVSLSAAGTWSTTPSSIVLVITGLAATGTTITLSTATPHGLVAGNIIVIAGATTLGVNGRWVLTAATSTSISFACTASPAVLGTGATVYASKELLEGREYALELPSVPTESVYKAESFSETPTDIETFVNGAFASLGTTDALSIDIGVTTTGHRVEAPGQCNLTGERYVLVRSPDIEQHINRNFAAAFDRMAPGLGMLKLGGGTGGFRDERFNFLAYATRTFHPIGKLNGLHIRLETRAGRVYDSHGIDHTLLVCVRMYAPAASRAIPKTLYPNYDPNTQAGFSKKVARDRDP
jgi:hypothetical protein